MLNDVCAAFQLASTLIGLIVDEFLLNMYMRFAAGLDAVCLVSRAKLCVCNGRRSFFFRLHFNAIVATTDFSPLFASICYCYHYRMFIKLIL